VKYCNVKYTMCIACSQRLSAGELLKHKFLKARTKDALVHELLDNITAVGAPDGEVVGKCLSRIYCEGKGNCHCYA
jgi:hypothetical protein